MSKKNSVTEEKQQLLRRVEPLINTWEPAEDIYLRPPQPRQEMESAAQELYQRQREQEGVGGEEQPEASEAALVLLMMLWLRRRRRSHAVLLCFLS